MWKILKDMGIPDYPTVYSEKPIHIQVRKQQLGPYLEQLTGSKLGKEYDTAVYCHPVYFTYMQGTSREILGWMNRKLESRLPGEISTASHMQMIPH